MCFKQDTKHRKYKNKDMKICYNYTDNNTHTENIWFQYSLFIYLSAEEWKHGVEVREGI